MKRANTRWTRGGSKGALLPLPTGRIGMSDPQTNKLRGSGEDECITRRDFLGSTLLASGAFLLNGLTPAELLASAQDDWTGYGGIGDYRASNGNTLAVLEAGHKMRDGAYKSLLADPVDTGDTYDCVVVGGGISGIAA